MSNGSVWNPENIKDVAESVGIANLNNEVVDHLTRDVEFRIAQVLEEALKFMRHAKRTTLFTQDISQALRALDAEPLYGYDSTRPLRFGEASIGVGQPLYYVEDEEVDFEKLINAPLPKVPREIGFTAHWLAVEGVQPKIPQNPTPAGTAARNDLLPKGPGANAHLAATAGADNVAVKPLVKHVLSSELQLYFEHVCTAVLDESNDEYRLAALSSLRTDPGLHQLVPYFVQFVAEKVTHNLKSLFTLTQMLHLVAALLSNPHLHVSPYVAALVPSVLTCLISKRLGPASTDPAAYPAPSSSSTAISGPLPLHYELRDLAASLVTALTRKEFAASTPTIKPRLARTLLKVLLSASAQPLGSYYGAVRGLTAVAGAEGVRVLLLPNLGALDEVLKDVIASAPSESTEDGRARRREVDKIVEAVVAGLELLDGDGVWRAVSGGGGDGDVDMESSDHDKIAVYEKVGEVTGERIMRLGRRSLIKAIMTQDVAL